MREILFRAKRIYNGEWAYGNLVIDKDGNPHIVETSVVEEDGHHVAIDSDIPMFIDPEAVGQFTGITDAVGIKIFEGDIIWDGDWECIGEIQWSEDCLSWMVATTDGETEWFEEFVNSKLKKADSSKVIGNRWDNPKLLEGAL